MLKHRTDWNLTKQYYQGHAPYGITISHHYDRYLRYKNDSIRISRYGGTDGRPYHYLSSLCHYNERGHATLRECIKHAKERHDAGLTWNSSDLSLKYL